MEKAKKKVKKVKSKSNEDETENTSSTKTKSGKTFVRKINFRDLQEEDKMNIYADYIEGKFDKYSAFKGKNASSQILDEFMSDASEDEDSKSKYAPNRSSSDEEERLARTLFVGNLPMGYPKRKLAKMFKKALNENPLCVENNCQIESIRLRGCIAKTGGTSSWAKKRACLKKEFKDAAHYNMVAYIVYTHLSGVESGLTLNGKAIEISAVAEKEDDEPLVKYIRVSRANENTRNNQNTVFLGNLPLACTEDAIRKEFNRFGGIANIRLVRDLSTGAVKGVGYVEFTEFDSVKEAVRLSGQIEIGNRMIRIDRWKQSVLAKKEKDKHMKKKAQKKNIPLKKNKKKVIVPTNVKGGHVRQFVKKKLLKFYKKPKKASKP